MQRPTAAAPAPSELWVAAVDDSALPSDEATAADLRAIFAAPWELGVSTTSQRAYVQDVPAPDAERPTLDEIRRSRWPRSLTSASVLPRPAAHTPAARRLGANLLAPETAPILWQPGLLTDANGVATVGFAAPDHAGTFRCRVIAADRGHRLGAGTVRFTVAQPLQLQPALPAFLRMGDVVQAAVGIHNATDRAGNATVQLTTDRRLRSAGAGAHVMTLAAGARDTARFELAAAEAGDAELRFSASMNDARDEREVRLPVRPASPVRVAEIAAGTASSALRIAVAPPPGALAGSTELVVSVDPDGIAGVERAIEEIVRDPYDGLAQTAAQVIALTTARDLAQALAIDGLAGPALDHLVTAGIAQIAQHQTASGGFSLWPGGEPETYATAYALWALYRAQRAGHHVERGRVTDGLAALRGSSSASSDTQIPATPRTGEAAASNAGRASTAISAVAATTADSEAAAHPASSPRAPTTSARHASSPATGPSSPTGAGVPSSPTDAGVPSLAGSALGRRGDRAFALYVRALLGDEMTDDALGMARDAAPLPIYGKAFLARALAIKLGAKHAAVQSLVSELTAFAARRSQGEANAKQATGTSRSAAQPNAAQPNAIQPSGPLPAATSSIAPGDLLIEEPGGRELTAHLSSALRTSAIVLAALVELDGANAAVAPLARGVMQARADAPRLDTQSDVYALLALTAYAHAQAATTSAATVALDGATVLAGPLGAQRLHVAVAPLARAGELRLTATGNVHYRVAVRYRPVLGALGREAHGLSLSQEYLDEAGRAKWAFRVGDRVRVRLTTEVTRDADHLVISAVLPAGFAAVDTSFAAAGAPASAAQGTYRAMHDDRVDIAVAHWAPGRHVVEFRLRAVAAGRFLRPPSVALLLYAPTVRAQTALDTIEIAP